MLPPIVQKGVRRELRDCLYSVCNAEVIGLFFLAVQKKSEPDEKTLVNGGIRVDVEIILTSVG